MSAEKTYDLAVLGGGPGGYVAAIRAAQEGLATVLVEADRLGGVCLNWGCIPSKALLRSAEVYELCRRAEDFGVSTGEVGYDWEAIVRRSRQVSDRVMRGVNYLMKKNGITVIQGRGSLAGEGRIKVEGREEHLLRAKNIILATGARAKALPGITPDGEKIVTSREALILQHNPRSIVIVGGGAIGLEFAYLFHTFGSEVTVVELLERILPNEDAEVSEELRRLYQKKGMHILTGSKVAGIRDLEAEGLEVRVATAENEELISCDKILVAVGVTGNVEGLGLEEAGVECKKGFIAVDRTYRTAAPGVRAIGDCIGAPLLAHAASREGLEAVAGILGRECRFVEPELIPSCTYCQPQVASVGLSESAAAALGFDLAVGKFPFRPLGKALAAGETEGFVKVIAEKNSGRLLGVHILGAEATELIPEASLARWLDSTALQLHEAVHPHPTLSEALMEAAAAATGKAIHL